MAVITPNLTLTVWNDLTDPYDSSQLAQNFIYLDQHDHSSGKGVPIGNSGLVSTSQSPGAEAVNTNVIRDSAITTAKIVDGAITSAKIADGAIVTIDIADNAVTTPKIADINITTAKIADLNVTTEKINDLAVTNGKLNDGAVTTAKLADSTSTTTGVTTTKIADSAITTAKIADGAIVNADVNASAAIAYSKLNLTGAVLNADLAGSIQVGKLDTTSVRLNTIGTPTANVSMTTSATAYKITDLATPTVSTDASTKGYVDSNFQPLSTKLTNIAALAASGFISFNNSTSAVNPRTITGDSGSIITFTNGDGVSGNPTLTFASQTANTILAAPVGGGVPTFRAVTASQVGALASTSTLATIASTNASTGAITASSQQITNLANPTATTDAANKAYVDSAVSGLNNKKDAVDVATRIADSYTYTISGNAVTQISGTTIDGQTVTTGQRILIKDAPAATGTGSANSSQPANGIYVAGTVAANIPVSRATDMDATSEVALASTFVKTGTTNAGTSWSVGTFTGGALNGSTAADQIKWVQNSGSLVYSGTSGISVAGTSISLASSTAGSGLTYTSGVLSINANQSSIITTLGTVAISAITGLSSTTYNGSTSGTTQLLPSAIAGTGSVLTLPSGTDTLVGKATTDSFTNKTFNTASTGNVLQINSNTVSGISGTGSTAVLTGGSPTFTGTPAAPTAAVDTNTTQLATTAFVLAQAGSATPVINGTAAVGTSTRFARQDHVHPTDTTRAPAASPTFTGTITTPLTAGGFVKSTASTGVLTVASIAASDIPDATTSTKGGVIIGSGIGVSTGTISLKLDTNAGTSGTGVAYSGLKVDSTNGLSVYFATNPGLQASSTGISVKPTTGVTVTSSGVGVDTTVVPLKSTSNVFTQSSSTTSTISIQNSYTTATANAIIVGNGTTTNAVTITNDGQIAASGAVTGLRFNGSGAGLTNIPNTALTNSGVMQIGSGGSYNTISPGGTIGTSSTPISNVYLDAPVLSGNIGTPLTASSFVKTNSSQQLTTTSTLTGTDFGSQAVNLVLASPGSGSTAGAPTFRSLVVADLPSMTSAEFASKLSDETGSSSGVVVFNNTPTIASPNLTGTTTAVNVTASGTVQAANAKITGLTATAGAIKPSSNGTLTTGLITKTDLDSTNAGSYVLPKYITHSAGIGNLPSSPSVGDEVYYQVIANESVWHLRWNGNNWDYLGGGGLFTTNSTNTSANAATDTSYIYWGNRAVNTMAIPLPGVYLVVVRAVYNATTNTAQGVFSSGVSLGTTPTSGNNTGSDIGDTPTYGYYNESLNAPFEVAGSPARITIADTTAATSRYLRQSMRINSCTAGASVTGTLYYASISLIPVKITGNWTTA